MKSFVTFYHKHFGNAENVLKAAQHDIAALANSMGFNGSAVTQVLSLAGHELKFDGGKYKLAEHTKNHGRCAVWARIERTDDGLDYPFITLKFKGDVATYSGLTAIQQAWQEHKAGHALPSKPIAAPARKKQLASRKEQLDAWRVYQANNELAQIWPVAKPELGNNPYFADKQIQAVCQQINAKVLADKHGVFTAIPLQSHVFTPNGLEFNPFVGFQRLYYAGGKFQTPAAVEGQFKGAYSIIGPQPFNSAECNIYYAEGYATAATGHLATGSTSVFCMSSGNILAVIAAFMQLYPYAKHVMLADNDHVKQREGKGNAGLRAAIKAKQQFGDSISVYYPQLDSLSEIAHKVTDFNDIHCFSAKGLKTVTKQLASAAAKFELGKDAFLTALQELRYNNATQAKRLAFKAVAAAVNVGPAKYSGNDVISYLQVAATSAGLTLCYKTLSIFYSKLMQERIAHANSLRSFTTQTTEHPRVNYRHFSQGTTPQTVADYIKALPKNAVVLFRAPMAFGKTNVIIRQLAEQADYALYTCHRRSLTSGVAEQLNFQHYVDDKTEMQQGLIQKTAVCVNSITQNHFNSFFENYLQDLYIDEASQVLNHICLGGAIENPLAVFRQLKSAINAASGKVLLLDADANDLTAKFALRSAGDKPVYVINLDANCNDFTMLHGNYNQVFKMAVDAIHGQTVLLATDSKPKAEQVVESWQQACPDKRFLLITTDTVGNDDVQEFFKNPSARCRDYHGIAFSPCISSGVSIQAAINQAPHFQRHFGLFCGQVGPNEAVQMLRRDRNARHFEIGLQTQHSQAETNPELLLQTIRHNLFKSGFITAEECKLTVDWQDPQLPMHSYSPDAPFELMAVELTAAFNAARKDFANIFLCQLMADNYQVARLPECEEEAKAGKELAGFAKEAINQKLVNLHLAEPTATDEEAAALTAKAMHSSISEQERARLNRYTLEKKLFVAITPETILWLCRDAMQHVANFELLHAPEQQLHDYVKSQIEAGKGLVNIKQAKRKQQALHYILGQLGVSIESGQGEFTSTEVENLLNQLKAKTGSVEMMRAIGINIDAKCAGSWAVALFARLGLKLDKTRRTLNGKKITCYSVLQQSYVTESGKLTPGWQLMAQVYRNRCAAGITSWESKLVGAEINGHDLSSDLIYDRKIVSDKTTGLMLEAVAVLTDITKRATDGFKVLVTGGKTLAPATAAAAIPAMLDPAESVYTLSAPEKLALYSYIERNYAQLAPVCQQYRDDYQLLALMHEYAPTPHVALRKLNELMQDKAQPAKLRQGVLKRVASQFDKWFSASDIESFEQTITSN